MSLEDCIELRERIGLRATLALALDEKLARKQRALHAGPGGLLHFVRDFWRVLEPATPFVEGWALEAMALHLEATADGRITRLLENVPPGSMKSLLSSVFFPAWLWGPKQRPAARFLCMSYTGDNPERDNRKTINLIQSPEYQRLYGQSFKLTKAGEELIETDKTGSKQALGIRGGVTGKRADFLIVDDPNNISEAESETIRDETNRKFREAVTNRLNDLVNSVIVVIQQRSAEDDVSGTILEMGWPYVHLCIPMLYEPDRHCETWLGDELFWADPREDEGECYWPERYPDEAVQIAMDMGDFSFCTPGESPVLMADLSLRPIRDVAVGDLVVGFTSAGGQSGERRYQQRRTIPSRVGQVTRSRRPVVKITLDSGRIIRCTEDHEWFTRRSGKKSNGASHAEYLSAGIGRTLWRVCDPELPVLTDPGDIRDAGWLGGFYDAEGSYSIAKRKGYEGSPQGLITFTQGTGRNLPLCRNLERILDKFGFAYGMHDRSPRDHQNHNQRTYYLLRPRGSTISVCQKFLHIAKPLKWVNRIVDGAYGSNFLMGGEKVVSIEPDGVDGVYGLTTETGNYVVWGLASKNCGQYQQRPTPRGGGILKLDYWRDWDPEPDPRTKRKDFPACDFRIASLDPAFTSKEENDPAGFTIWGTFLSKEGDRGAILLDAFRERLEIIGVPIEREAGETVKAYKERTSEHWGLVETIYERCVRFKVDVLLVENKASGLSIVQTLEKLMRTMAKTFGAHRFRVEIADPRKLDKMARVVRVLGEFSGGYIYAPQAKSWAMMVINECAAFPKGRYDDLVDSTTQAIYWLRSNGFLERREEQFLSREEAMKKYKQTGSIYDA